MAAVLGVLLGLLARLWVATLRVRLILHPALAESDPRRWVFTFFHGTQFPLLAWKRRGPTVVLVSLSSDGEMQSKAMARQGFLVVRGSSTRGGARGLAALVRVMKRGADAAFAVDGPRGPYGVAKPGARLAARAVGGVLVPMGSAIASGKVLRHAWDLFALPWPFTRVAVVLGAPCDPASVDEAALSRRIADVNATARVALAPQPLLQRPA